MKKTSWSTYSRVPRPRRDHRCGARGHLEIRSVGFAVVVAAVAAASASVWKANASYSPRRSSGHCGLENKEGDRERENNENLVRVGVKRRLLLFPLLFFQAINLSFLLFLSCCFLSFFLSLTQWRHTSFTSLYSHGSPRSSSRIWHCMEVWDDGTVIHITAGLYNVYKTKRARSKYQKQL